MCSPAASTPHIGKHIHTQRQTWTHKSKGPGRKRNLGRDCSFQLPLLDEEKQLPYLGFPSQPRRWDPIGEKGEGGELQGRGLFHHSWKKGFSQLCSSGPDWTEI